MTYRFDTYLEFFHSETLKRMARRWTSKPPSRKLDNIELIKRSLDDAARVRAMVATLQPFELTALQLVKLFGGVMEISMLAVALHATGVQLPDTPQRSYDSSESGVVEVLVKGGLLLSERDEYTYYASWRGGLVFADERVLAHIGPPRFLPLGLKPVKAPAVQQVRRPPTVMLDLISLLQTLEHAGGIRVTQTGSLRTSDTRKLVRAMHWHEEAFDLDGIAFPYPAGAFASALFHSGLLQKDVGVVRLRASATELAARPVVDQVRDLVFGFVSTPEWTEQDSGILDAGEGSAYTRGRLALLIALASLPIDTDEFFAFEDLSEALFARIGTHFSLGYRIYMPMLFRETPEQLRKKRQVWRSDVHAKWQANEHPWLAAALSTWLYYLGMIELGRRGSELVALRLTALGKAVLHPELDRPVHAATQPQAAWVVQPNLEIVVYLDQATAPQMAFMERHAERVSAQPHTAQYRLTRDSVYRGLESGTSVDALLSSLRQGAHQELPQNVQVEIRGWGRLREHMSLRHSARLLEFDSAAARDAALLSAGESVAVGERFLLLAPNTSVKRFRVAEMIDYAQPLAACLVVDEDGVLSITERAGDLLVEAQLDRWAERQPNGTWRLSAASVAGAMKGGARERHLFEWLAERLVRPLPAILALALHAWAGKSPEATLARVTILRCEDANLFEAIRTSKRSRHYLHGTLAPNILLVKTEQLAAMQALLEWMGVRLNQRAEQAQM